MSKTEKKNESAKTADCAVWTGNKSQISLELLALKEQKTLMADKNATPFV